jgi:hypothetical protein
MTDPDVERWLQTFAAEPIDLPAPPSPTLLWWHAQLERRLEIEQQSARPIAIAEWTQAAVASLGLVALLAWRILR